MTSPKQMQLFEELPVVSPLLSAVIRARSVLEPEATAPAIIPTSPATSLPWSEDCGPGGWSAKMFLHQMIATSRPAWNCSDTERLLSEQMPLRLHLSKESEISLSEQIKPPGRAFQDSFVSSNALRGILRRVLARNKSFRVLLRSETATIPVTVTFGNRPDCVSLTVTSEQPLPDSLLIGFLDCLRQHLPGPVEMPSFRQSPKNSPGPLLPLRFQCNENENLHYSPARPHGQEVPGR